MEKCDVFISFKNTDEHGNLTEDYQIAINLYDTLFKMGYQVFLSPITLEIEGSSQFTEDIDDVLDCARSMVVVVTKVEHALGRWVKYEWNSFYTDYLSERRDDVNLYVLIQNVKLNDLPRKLRNSQCFSYKGDLSTICNFINNKLRGNKENQLDLYPNVNTKRVNKKEDASEEESKTSHTGSDISYDIMIPKQALQYNLALRYEMGQGVEKDEKIAFELYEKAANLNDADAQYKVGYFYYHGIGVEKDYIKAFYWYKKASELGNVVAQYNLGICYFNGTGVIQDFNKAIYWLEKASVYDLDKAQYALGYCYTYGYGVEKDLKKAIYWYQRAANNGLEIAQEALNRVKSESRE